MTRSIKALTVLAIIAFPVTIVAGLGYALWDLTRELRATWREALVDYEAIQEFRAAQARMNQQKEEP
jgi:hypothetical protein